MGERQRERDGVDGGAAAWLAGRLPDGWFEGPPEVVVDREEILVIGRLAAPGTVAGVTSAGPSDGPATSQDAPAAPDEQTSAPGGSAGDEDSAAARAAEAGRIARFREQTRAERMQIADEAESRYGRKVAWGAQAGGTRVVFTSLSVPVMTRLRQPERRVLDTLVAAGVARSRSDALAWSVRLVGRHADDWLAELREALQHVDRVRSQGPA